MAKSNEIDMFDLSFLFFDGQITIVCCLHPHFCYISILQHLAQTEQLLKLTSSEPS